MEEENKEEQNVEEVEMEVSTDKSEEMQVQETVVEPEIANKEEEEGRRKKQEKKKRWEDWWGV